MSDNLGNLSSSASPASTEQKNNIVSQNIKKSMHRLSQNRKAAQASRDRKALRSKEMQMDYENLLSENVVLRKLLGYKQSDENNEEATKRSEIRKRLESRKMKQKELKGIGHESSKVRDDKVISYAPRKMKQHELKGFGDESSKVLSPTDDKNLCYFPPQINTNLREDDLQFYQNEAIMKQLLEITDSVIADMKPLDYQPSQYNFLQGMAAQTEIPIANQFSWYYFSQNVFETPLLDSLSPWHNLNEQSPLVLDLTESLVYPSNYHFQQMNNHG
jgi:hypothetical protein